MDRNLQLGMRVSHESVLASLPLTCRSVHFNPTIQDLVFFLLPLLNLQVDPSCPHLAMICTLKLGVLPTCSKLVLWGHLLPRVTHSGLNLRLVLFRMSRVLHITKMDLPLETLTGNDQEQSFGAVTDSNRPAVPPKS